MGDSTATVTTKSQAGPHDGMEQVEAKEFEMYCVAVKELKPSYHNGCI